MYDNLFDAEARVAAIYPIHGIGDSETPPEWVEEFLFGCGSTDLQAIAEHCPELAKIDPDHYAQTRDLAFDVANGWVLKARQGYIVEAHVCVRSYLDSSSSWYSGWGHYQIYWIYVASADDAIARTIELANRQHDEAQTKAGAA